MNPITEHVHLVDREVMDAYGPQTHIVDSPFVSLNTPTEFVVTIEGSPLDQLVGVLDESGVITVSRHTMRRTDNQMQSRVLWTTNDRRALSMEVLIKSGSIPVSVKAVDWRNPFWLDQKVQGAPGVVYDQGVVTWNEGRSWIRENREWGDTGVGYLAAWLPFTPKEVLDSFEKPPGVVGLIPYVNFQRISVEEGQAITAELQRRRQART